MILRFYPKKDATIYELYPEKNTGLDAVLDISKTISSTQSFNSRVLIDFDYTAISQSIVSLGKNPNNFNYFLKLYTTEANEIPVDYTLYCYSLSEDWNMGVGRFGNIPQTTDGVSWYYRESKTNPATAWPTNSFASTVTASWNESAGGGSWYTSSVASQSFSYTTSDVNMNVTSLIREIQSGSHAFHGFIIKKSDSAESSSDIFNSVKFFSKDTHTVYLPVLEARFDDSVNTGSLGYIDMNQDVSIVLSNLKKNYSEKSSPIFRFAARYTYPVQTFTTSSLYLDEYKLPTGSMYGIRSAQSEDMIIDFDETYTKLSHDNNGSYAKLHLDSFQPERLYKILLKVPNSANAYDIFDRDWIFKVTRS